MKRRYYKLVKFAARWAMLSVLMPLGVLAFSFIFTINKAAYPSLVLSTVNYLYHTTSGLAVVFAFGAWSTMVVAVAEGNKMRGS